MCYKWGWWYIEYQLKSAIQHNFFALPTLWRGSRIKRLKERKHSRSLFCLSLHHLDAWKQGSQARKHTGDFCLWELTLQACFPTSYSSFLPWFEVYLTVKTTSPQSPSIFHIWNRWITEKIDGTLHWNGRLVCFMKMSVIGITWSLHPAYRLSSHI